jgi:hypothetical protein
MIPSVGRIVHYYTRLREQQSDDGFREGPYAAMITNVRNGTNVVDLMVVPNGREGYHAIAVQEGGTSFFCWWEWPPLV